MRHRTSVFAALLALAVLTAASAAQAGSRRTYSYSIPTPARTDYHRSASAAGKQASAAGIAPVPANAGWDEGAHTRARRAFMRKEGFPMGRPGYVVDYIVPLSQGGAESPSNMRWVRIDDIPPR